MSIADIFLILLWIELKFVQSALGSQCDFEGHIDIWGQWQGQCIFFLYRLISQFITPPILESLQISNYRRWQKELPVLEVLRNQYI